MKSNEVGAKVAIGSARDASDLSAPVSRWLFLLERPLHPENGDKAGRYRP